MKRRYPPPVVVPDLVRLGVATHVQPGGEVVMSVRLADGRVARVCGGRPDGGLVVAEGMTEWLLWLAQGAGGRRAPR